MAKQKVEVAIFDNDLRCRTIQKYEISNDGEQIRIKSGGEGHFMPKFDNDSFIEMPRRKRYFLFGEMLYRRLYFVKKKGNKCVNFQTGESFGPSAEQLKQAIGSTLLPKIGQGKQETPLILWLLLAGIVFSILIQLGVLS